MSDQTDRPGYSFNPGSPPEASRYLRNKGMRPSFSWLDVEPEEHAVAFTVAKTGEVDLVDAMRVEVQRALDDGLPFESFKKNWMSRPALAEWLGRTEMEDPLTGEMVEIRRSPARRLRTIYDANLRSARAAGQWERIERTKDAFPYLEYLLGPSDNHRPHHVDKAGMILAVGSPFWDEWMPPNGWGCKCHVRQVTRREAERRGISATPDVPDTVWTNPRTGARRLVPKGIDPGWERNPGKLRLTAVEGLLKDRLVALPEPVRRAALRDIASSWRLMRLATDPEARGNVPVAILPQSYGKAAGTDLEVIEFSDITRDHVFTKEKGRRVQDLEWLAWLDVAQRVALQRRRGQSTRLIFEIDAASNLTAEDPYERMPLRVVIVVKAVGLFVDTMHRTTDRRWQSLKKQASTEVLKE